MITLQDLSAALQELFAPFEFADYCPNGLQVEGKGGIARVAFAVSASLAVIQECVHRNVDVLIVHHGIFWNKDSYILTGPKERSCAFCSLMTSLYSGTICPSMLTRRLATTGRRPWIWG